MSRLPLAEPKPDKPREANQPGSQQEKRRRLRRRGNALNAHAVKDWGLRVAGTRKFHGKAAGQGIRVGVGIRGGCVGAQDCSPPRGRSSVAVGKSWRYSIGIEIEDIRLSRLELGYINTLPGDLGDWNVAVGARQAAEGSRIDRALGEKIALRIIERQVYIAALPVVVVTKPYGRRRDDSCRVSLAESSGSWSSQYCGIPIKGDPHESSSPA